MIYGYLRVSSDEQDVNSQKQGVEDFAKQKGWTIEKYITDEGVSGGKDPSKRNLGALLNGLKEGDIIIASEISRLGRDLYMVMDILHHCMKTGCIIYTVKDKFVLGDDIQSKVLAFAFGLSAEIERQMIRQRTKEGLKLRVKMGVLLGRTPIIVKTDESIVADESTKKAIIEQYKWGVPLRRLADNFNIDRNTLMRWLHRWGVVESKFIERQEKLQEEQRILKYKEGDYQVINLRDDERDKIINLIKANLTLPQICDAIGTYTYEQVYDTFMCDKQLNTLYRKYGQKKLTKKK